MTIVIIGAGHAGRELATRLCSERHNVVMVDVSMEALEQCETSLDVLTVCGSGSDPDVLESAGVDRADLVVAVTDRDEINILACLLAHSAGVPRKIARVGKIRYDRYPEKYNLTKMGIDLVINQKQACAKEICNALLLPAAIESFELFEGHALVAGLPVGGESPIVGYTPATLPDQNLLSKLRIIAVRRRAKLIIPRGDTLFEADDILYLVGTRQHVLSFSLWINPRQTPFEKIIVAGGGDIGLATAMTLEKAGIEVVLLEQDDARALYCSSELSDSLVLRADALSGSALDETGIVPRTAFVAVTGDDENNVMNCLMARKRGADFVITQIARTEYIPVMETLGLVDRIVSPYESITSGILHYLRSRNVRAAALLHDLPGELLDVELAGTSRYVGHMVSEIRFPQGAIIAVVRRNNDVIPATGNLKLAIGDRLLVFAVSEVIKKIQAMFLK